ncbi:MAG: PAS domain S-box protein [Candidatus Omnitrophica bacterium]|nr:PAS domain S-box protein [Candidatus Omnitrophota bacterium]
MNYQKNWAANPLMTFRFWSPLRKNHKENNEDWVSRVLDAALDAIIQIDDQGRVIEWNKNAEVVFGWKREEILGMFLSETIVPAQHREAHKKGLRHYLLTGEGPVLNKRIEITALHRSGKEFPVELAITPVHLAGKLIFNAFLRDITGHKRAEERFRLVVESAPNAMVMIDQTGRVVLVSAQTEKLFGYSRQELIGKPIEMLVPGRFRPQHPGYRDDFFAKPQIRPMGAGRDLYGLRKDGTEVPIEIGLNPIKTEEGAFVLAAVVDITPRKAFENQTRDFTKNLEEQVKQRTLEINRQRVAALNIMEDANEAKKGLEKSEREEKRRGEELARSNKELEQFAYVASHDLQEPIRKIVGFTQLLAGDFEDKLGHESRVHMDFIVDGAKRMQALIQDLLQYSRTGTAKLIFRATDLNAVVAEALSNLELRVKETQAEVIYKDLPTLKANKIFMVSLFQNLIGNSLKFRSEEAPRIEIDAKKTDEGYEFTVTDNGIGIDPQFAGRLFVIFQRLHPKDQYEGTGIGLAVCKRIVERHGGRIWIEPGKGKGSMFKFTLLGR